MLYLGNTKYMHNCICIIGKISAVYVTCIITGEY